MKNIISTLSTAVVILSVSCSAIEPAKSPPKHSQRPVPLQARLDSLLSDTALASCFIGINITALDGGTTLYERNGLKLFHPASNMKLLTTAAALKMLGSGFMFRTAVWADGPVKAGVVSGDLYVHGTGDPLITTDDLDSLAARIRDSGIKVIKGDIVGDVSQFDSLFWGPGWMWDDEPGTSMASITPLTVNSNAIEFTAYPGRRNGDPVAILYDAPEGYFTLRNEALTSTDTLIPPLSITRRRGENIIEVRGRITPGTRPQRSSLSIWKPEQFFLELFRRELIRGGISVLGRTRLGASSGTFKLGEISHQLDSVIQRINKLSDNLAAENTLKTLSVEKHGIPGTTAGGIAAIKVYLSSIGIDTTRFTAADGSGESSYNEISPDIIVALLRKQYDDKAVYTRFSESLPVAGADGTLKTRMKGTAAERNVHAKTGTTTGVSTLSGYVTTQAGMPLVFSIMCNHFPGDLQILRSLQDTIMVVLANLQVTSLKEGE